MRLKKLIELRRNSCLHPYQGDKTVSEDLLTTSFNRQNHQSPTSRRKFKTPLKCLKEDESIMVLPADNGRASVVMDTDTYNTKMFTLIENGPYQLLKRDPTDPLNRKLSKKFLTLKRGGYLSDSVCNKIRPRHTVYRRFTRPIYP